MKKYSSVCVMILGLTYCANASDSIWTELGRNKKCALYIHNDISKWKSEIVTTEMIEKENVWVVWTKTVNLKKKTNDNTEFIVSCRDRIYSEGQSTITNKDGEVIQSTPRSNYIKFRNVEPETFGEAIVDYVCLRKF